MLETIKNAFRNKDIRKKLLLTFLLLLIFRLGCYIPVPGLKRASFESAITGNDSTVGTVLEIYGCVFLYFFRIPLHQFVLRIG